MKENQVTISFSIHPDQLAEIDRITERLKLSRSKTMTNFMAVAIDDFKTLEATGIVKMAEIGMEIYKSISESRNEMILKKLS